MKETNTYAILMADIIKSRRADARVLISDLKKLVELMNQKWSGTLLSPLTITLGDEFQGVIRDMKSAIEMIIAMEEMVVTHGLQIKLRYVLNYGIIETPLNAERAYEMLGPGLTEAREKLEFIKTNRNRFFVMNAGQAMQTQMINDLLQIYGKYIDDWSVKDLYFVAAFLNLKDYKRVAEVTGINVASAWKRKKSLNIDEYFTCKKALLNPINYD